MYALSANRLRFSPAYLADSRKRRERTTQKRTMDVDFFFHRQSIDVKRSFSAQIPNAAHLVGNGPGGFLRWLIEGPVIFALQ